MDCSTPGLPVHHQLLKLPKLMSIKWVMPSSHLILYRPLLLLHPIPLSIRVFLNESALCIRWSKYWSFNFNISPSNEYPGLLVICISSLKKKKISTQVFCPFFDWIFYIEFYEQFICFGYKLLVGHIICKYFSTIWYLNGLLCYAKCF